MVTEKQKANLKPCSPQEARERGSKGGKKRAENIAKRKSIKEDLLAMLETPQQNGKTIQQNWMIAIAKQILKGDIKASTFVRDTIGERPKELLELESNDISGIKIKFVDKSKANDQKETDPKIIGDYTPPSNIEE